MFCKRHDSPIDLAAVPSFISPEGSVLIDSDFVAVLYEHAWVNFKIAVDQSVNFIEFDLELTSDLKGQGLMTLFDITGIRARENGQGTKKSPGIGMPGLSWEIRQFDASRLAFRIRGRSPMH